MRHIDLAGTYICRYTSEICAVHFGGSHRQVSVHTGVVYNHDSNTFPFCTISDYRQYDPCVSWCYFQIVIQWIARFN